MALRRSPGLVDKLNGIRTNLLTNGSFSFDTSSWTGTSANLSSTSGGQNGNCLTMQNATAAAATAHQDYTTRTGRVHRVSFYVKNGTGAGGAKVRIKLPAGDELLVSSTYTASDWTEYQLVFIATGPTTRIQLENVSTTNGDSMLFDTITVEEVLEGFREIMRGCKVNVYSGSQPATADLAATGTLLYTLTKDGDGVTGLSWGDSSGGVIAKASTENWRGTAVAAGTAGWFRCFEDGDNPATQSSTAARFDGAIATSNSEMNMTNTSIELGAIQTCTTAAYTAPM